MADAFQLRIVTPRRLVLDEPVREIHRKLKEILDPNGILNPGKFVD